jgi:hypothetical protein
MPSGAKAPLLVSIATTEVVPLQNSARPKRKGRARGSAPYFQDINLGRLNVTLSESLYFFPGEWVAGNGGVQGY